MYYKKIPISSEGPPIKTGLWYHDSGFGYYVKETNKWYRHQLAYLDGAPPTPEPFYWLKPTTAEEIESEALTAAEQEIERLKAKIKDIGENAILEMGENAALKKENEELKKVLKSFDKNIIDDITNERD